VQCFTQIGTCKTAPLPLRRPGTGSRHHAVHIKTQPSIEQKTGLRSIFLRHKTIRG
jgi:hypothetical protein